MVSLWGNIWSFYVDFAYQEVAAIVVVFLKNMGSTGVGELVVKELTDGGSFFGRDVAEVLVTFGVDDFDGVLVVLVFGVGDQLRVEVCAGEVFDSPGEIDTCNFGVVEVWVDIRPIHAVVVRERAVVCAIDDGPSGVVVEGFVRLSDCFELCVCQGSRFFLWWFDYIFTF